MAEPFALHQIEPELGERMIAFGVVLKGKLSPTRWISFLYRLAEAIGMNSVADPAIWHYPIEGKGGNGHTIVLPITESFLALDTWPDHDGAYLFICSCKEFIHIKVDVTAREFGLECSVNERFFRSLRLT